MLHALEPRWIRVTGTDAYNPYIRSLCPSANSVATLIHLTTWTGAGGSAYRVSAVAGALTSTQPGGSVY